MRLALCPSILPLQKCLASVGFCLCGGPCKRVYALAARTHLRFSVFPTLMLAYFLCSGTVVWMDLLLRNLYWVEDYFVIRRPPEHEVRLDTQ